MTVRVWPPTLVDLGGFAIVGFVPVIPQMSCVIGSGVAVRKSTQFIPFKRVGRRAFLLVTPFKREREGRQSFLDAVAAGRLRVPIQRTYTLDEIATAYADMEAGRTTSKLVVLP